MNNEPPQRTWSHGERLHSVCRPSDPKWISCTRQFYGLFALGVIVILGGCSLLMDQALNPLVSLVAVLILAVGNIIGKTNT